MWHDIEPWIDKRQYGFVSFSMLVGLWLLTSSIIAKKVTSPAGVFTFNATLSNYSFTHGKKGQKHYYIWVKQHKSTFQIPADFLSLFDEQGFVKADRVGQRIFIGISKNDKNNIDIPNERIKIYDLYTDNKSFLSKYATVDQENNMFQYIVGPIFILAGLFFYVFRRRKLTSDYR